MYLSATIILSEQDILTIYINKGDTVMELNKIASKYCTAEKVQLMLSNAPRQIILSKDGYVYLREKDITVHRYLEDPVREKMPFKDNPSSKDHATHLFEYNKVYAKFTRYRGMKERYPFGDSYSLTFLYFIKAKDGGAICAEMHLGDFKEEENEETSLKMTRTELEKFLYSTDEVKSKCIFDWFSGMKYIKHNNERIGICNFDFIDLSEQGIINLYNRRNEPLMIFSDPEERKKKLEEGAWKVNRIEEIENFDLTYHGFMNNYSPMLLVINERDEMWVYEFKVTYWSKDCYKLTAKRRRITVNPTDIVGLSREASYTIEPNFDEE